VWEIKPVFDKDEAGALEALASFAASWLAADPRRGVAFPGGTSLHAKLVASGKDIRSSAFAPDPVRLDQPEASALIAFVRIFANAEPSHPAHIRLARWATGFAEVAQPPADYEVSRTAWQHATKSAHRVFLVSGRNRKAHNALVLWLKEFHLEVVVLESHSSRGSATTAESLETSLSSCGTAIILATADDQGRGTVDEDGRPLPPGKQGKSQPRPRQNVVLELGLTWGHLGRERIILLIDRSVEIGTDTAGFMTIRFDGDVRAAFEDLRKRLQAMGVISISTA
jgi:predicted nucleotide-binding protein